MSDDMSSFSMFELFRMEAEGQVKILVTGFSALHKDLSAELNMDEMVRAAHSLKGAARMVGNHGVADLSSIIEDELLQVKEGKSSFTDNRVSALMAAVEVVSSLSQLTEEELNSNSDKYLAEANAAETLLRASLGDEPTAGAVIETKNMQEQVANPDTATPASVDKEASSVVSDETEGFSMLRLFQIESQEQLALIKNALQGLESSAIDKDSLSTLMREANSIKNAARMVGLSEIGGLAGVIEDGMVACQEGGFDLSADYIRAMLQSIELIEEVLQFDEKELVDKIRTDYQTTFDDFEFRLIALLRDKSPAEVKTDHVVEPAQPETSSQTAPKELDNNDAAVQNDTAGSLENLSMLELFRIEAEGQVAILNEGLLALDETPGDLDVIEPLMRAAHSIKGAARMVALDSVVALAHVMEDCLVLAQEGKLTLDSDSIDGLLKGADFISDLSKIDQMEVEGWLNDKSEQLVSLQEAIGSIAKAADTVSEQVTVAPAKVEEQQAQPEAKPAPAKKVMDLADMSMLELFRVEADSQTNLLSEGLLNLEDEAGSPDAIEPLMRAAHSVKGAARMVGIDDVVRVAHVMEDSLVAAQEGKILLTSDDIDILLNSVDLIKNVSVLDDQALSDWFSQNQNVIDEHVAALQSILTGEKENRKPLQKTEINAAEATPATTEPAQTTEKVAPATQQKTATPASQAKAKEQVIRVSADKLTRMMGLAGELMVESRWLEPFAGSLLQLKRRQSEVLMALDGVRDALTGVELPERAMNFLVSAQRKALECRLTLSDRISDLDSFDRRASNLSGDLHREVIASRMRPFSDSANGFKRMVRDIAKSINKKVKFEIEGLDTAVDREVLEKIEAPLNHLLRNALDHGIETAEERALTDKPEIATITLSAVHMAGMLSIQIKDNGRGVPLEKLRAKVVKKGLVSEEMADGLSDEELLEFLFLPNFSTKDQVTELSGRGVGLDVVQDIMKEMRGTVRASSVFGEGTTFQMLLPLTLSVISALLVDVVGDSYAFPLSRVDRILSVPHTEIEIMEGRQYIRVGDELVGLVSAQQVFSQGDRIQAEDEDVYIVVISDRTNKYGVVVDRFLGQRELAVQSLDERLGKVPDINAGATLEDGTPTLIIDVEDMVRSIDFLIKGGRLHSVSSLHVVAANKHAKRILVVDDSITVREVERNLLKSRGYEVDVAVDGMDGWNAVRGGQYDLVVSDVDMPRMDGFELVSLIKNEPRLGKLPVMIVSYKDRPEDRARGLEVGADYYLTKGSFHDETLIEAVIDLIGEAGS